MLVGEKYRKYIRDVKAIPWELQHRLVVVDLDKKVERGKTERAKWKDKERAIAEEMG